MIRHIPLALLLLHRSYNQGITKLVKKETDVPRGELTFKLALLSVGSEMNGFWTEL